MHLTNYAINKSSSDFSRDDEAGSKRYSQSYSKRSSIMRSLYNQKSVLLWASSYIIMPSYVSGHNVVVLNRCGH